MSDSLTANGWLDDVAAIKPCGLGLAAMCGKPLLAAFNICGMKKAKQIIANKISEELGFPVHGVEYDISKSSMLMRVWKDEWYMSGHCFSDSGKRICFYSSLGVREIIKGCVARWSERDLAIHLHRLD